MNLSTLTTWLLAFVLFFMALTYKNHRDDEQNAKIAGQEKRIAALELKVAKETLSVNVRGVNKQYVEIYEVHPIVKEVKK